MTDGSQFTVLTCRVCRIVLMSESVFKYQSFSQSIFTLHAILCLFLSQTAILGTVFISAAGYRLIQSGIFIYYDITGENPFPLSERGLNDELEARDYDKTLSAGGLFLCLLWVRNAYMDV